MKRIMMLLIFAHASTHIFAADALWEFMGDKLDQFKTIYNAQFRNPNYKENGEPLLNMVHGVKIATFLLDQGADVNATDKFGNTPLIEATKNAKFDLVKLFVERGANVRAKNRRGQTAVDVAILEIPNALQNMEELAQAPSFKKSFEESLANLQRIIDFLEPLMAEEQKKAGAPPAQPARPSQPVARPSSAAPGQPSAPAIVRPAELPLPAAPGGPRVSRPPAKQPVSASSPAAAPARPSVASPASRAGQPALMSELEKALQQDLSNVQNNQGSRIKSTVQEVVNKMMPSVSAPLKKSVSEYNELYLKLRSGLEKDAQKLKTQFDAVKKLV